MVKVAVGSDDTYGIAKFVAGYIKSLGHEVDLFGALKYNKPIPWPNVAFEVATGVAKGKYDFGVLICYTGTGVSIAANKVKGVRAALCFDAKTAEGARLWNDANVLTLSARLLSEEVAKEIVSAWFSVKGPDPSEKANIERVKEFELRAASSASGLTEPDKISSKATSA